MTAITISQLSKRYGGTTALRDLDLHVKQGELLTLLGPSGSGKSTTLALIAGLALPSAGTIFLGQRDVTLLPPAKRNIGLVFQSYALFPHLSVRENIAFPLRIRRQSSKVIDKKVSDVLALLRLDGLCDRRPAQLSGGQQQRVALARALVFQPDILLLDEPMGALDKQLREEVQVELRRLQRALGTTTILVTHDQEEALSMSDRVMVLAEGVMQQVGPPQEIYSRPCNAFVAGFLGTANFLHGRLAATGTTARLELGEGDFLSLDTAALRPDTDYGTTVHAIVRPERTRLVPSAPDQEGLKGQVAEVVYLGQSVRYHIQTRHDRPFIVATNDKQARFSRGDPVTLSWPADAVWLLPPAGQASTSEHMVRPPVHMH